MTTLNITPVTAHFAVSPQLGPEQMAQVAAQGFRAVINNRPDGEAGPSQPADAAVSAAAKAAGLVYLYLPVPPSNATHEDVVLMKEALKSLPQPVLAYCRSGNRSRNLYNAAMSLA